MQARELATSEEGNGSQIQNSLTSKVCGVDASRKQHLPGVRREIEGRGQGAGGGSQGESWHRPGVCARLWAGAGDSSREQHLEGKEWEGRVEKAQVAGEPRAWACQSSVGRKGRDLQCHH